MSNCRELLPGKLQVNWEVQGDWVQVQLTGKIRENQYMAFGLSGNQNRLVYYAKYHKCIDVLRRIFYNISYQCLNVFKYNTMVNYYIIYSKKITSIANNRIIVFKKE